MTLEHNKRQLARPCLARRRYDSIRSVLELGKYSDVDLEFSHGNIRLNVIPNMPNAVSNHHCH